MKNYDLEISVVLDNHGLQQALGLQAKTGRSKSKILKMYHTGMQLINSDGSVGAAAFTANKRVRVNFIGHGDSASTKVADTAGVRSWTPESLNDDLHEALSWAIPGRAAYKFNRLSMIVCYGGGHTEITKNTYRHIVDPAKSFGYQFFEHAHNWVVDMTARTDVSATIMSMVGGAPDDSIDPAHFTGAVKHAGGQHKDKYRKVRFYMSGKTVSVESPYLGYA